MTTRFVVCVDVEEDNLELAYKALYQAMGQLPDGVEWESTDEVYGPDGGELGEEEIQAARMAFFEGFRPKE